MATARSRLRLHVVQAAYGDCLLVESRSPAGTRWLLVDGGPGGTYEAHLRPLLASLGARDVALDVAVLSHIDNDHVSGLLDLFEELRSRRPNAEPLPAIHGLWHNSFGQAAGSEALERPVREALRGAGRLGVAMPELALVLRGVGEGDALRNAALALGMPLNAGFPGKHVLVARKPVLMDDLTIHVVGPSRAVLEQLKEEWLTWLDRQRRPGRGGIAVDVASDRSIPNLSSISLLVELDRRTILLTGDARGDHLLEGLDDAGLLDEDGRCRVSVLKLPHHGSIRNIGPDFLRAVPASTYVVSADGRYGNPDHEALALVVETAREDGREIELAMTNRTPGADRLRRTHPPDRFGYRVRTLKAGASVLAVDATVTRRRIAARWT